MNYLHDAHKHLTRLYMMRYCREHLEGFWNFGWRPRPPSLLPAEKEREIVKNLKTFARKYEADDELLLAAAGSEQLQKRKQLRMDWEEWHATKADWILMQADHCTKVCSL